MGLAQLLADGDAHSIFGSPVFPGVEHQKTIGKAGGVVQAAEDVVEFQTG